MTPTSPRPDSSAALLLWQLAITFEDCLTAELARMNLTITSFRLIGEVMRAPDGLSEDELARRLKVSASRIAATVSEMAASGVLLLTPDPATDRHLVSLSESADLLPGIDVLANIEEVLLGDMSDEDQRAAQDLLVRLNRNLSPSA